ncbi:hypothetical protein OQA88_9606 [Cercophora sp. LCS_1]
MHILIVNDDGPPSPHSSPYVHSLVRGLQAAGHVVSVCLPHTQRSWIGKAHMIGQTVKPVYYRPPPPSKPAAGLSSPDEDEESHGTTHARPSTKSSVEEWILVDGTPASCVQIGLYHFFQDRGPVDLVVSGPNYGRNTTAVFALSSGTLGGALEAAVCKRRAIALSYAFFSRNHDPVVIRAAGRRSVKVIEALWRDWPEDGSVDLYSVNVPLVEEVESKDVLFTGMLQNYWGEGSCFTEVDGSVDGEAEDEERIREAEGSPEKEEAGEGKLKPHRHKHFKWSPRFTDVYRSVDEAPPGNDGWAVKEGFTSVTPLKANFFQTATQLHGGKLELSTESTKMPSPHLYALISYEDDYVQPLLLSAINSILPKDSFTLLSPPARATPDEPTPLSTLIPNPSTDKILQISPYESLDFDFASAHPTTCLVNSYIIRKALIRKHFLSATVDNWVAKHPESALRAHVKRSEHFEVDYAEFLDDALVEAWDLNASMERNGNNENGAEQLEWWILKPSMSDRGQGIKLFSSMEQLQGIFDAWDEGVVTDDEDEDENGQGGDADDDDGGIMASHLRHFVAQPYIHPPMLVEGRKFHLRVYVLAVGSMKVYVYRDMLALFASKEYVLPGTEDDEVDLDAHLTNTCLQGEDTAAKANSVRRFWELELPDEGVADKVFEQICNVTGELFEAAARGMMVHFQPLESAFEVYGLDFLTDAAGTAWLLEVNAFPDFKQTGDLTELVAGFWAGVLRLAVLPFASGGSGGGDGDHVAGREEKVACDMVLVRDVDLGRRWGS